MRPIHQFDGAALPPDLKPYNANCRQYDYLNSAVPAEVPKAGLASTPKYAVTK
jgi:hypothetical protein